MIGRTLALVSTLTLLSAGSAHAATGTITTVAGTGTAAFTGDLGPAGAAQLAIPVAVVSTPDGGYLIADQANNRIRRVSAAGTITTVAGSGTGPGYSGDGGPATSAKLSGPSGVAQLADGTILIADINNNAVRRVAPDGTITTAVGNGAASFSGDAGPASAATVRFPYDIAPLPGGGYLIADEDNNRIRKVDAAGTITTVAGNGAGGSGGDGGPATSAQLNDPSGVIVMPDGGFLIADTSNHRIRRVTAGGTISTYAGTTAGFSGDGGPATSAQLNSPIHLALLPDGSVVIADWHNNRIRKVDAGGTITTITGDGTAGSLGDGGLATAAQVSAPYGVGVIDGDVLVAEAFGHRIRRIDLGDPPPVTPPAPAQAQPPTAALSRSGGAACVGKPVTLDASASLPGTGGPIVRYEFSYADKIAGKESAQRTAIASTADAVVDARFNWNRTVDTEKKSQPIDALGKAKAAAITSLGSGLAPPDFVRDPAAVTLTVTDASGAKASATQTVEFAQASSAAPRTPCGDAAEVVKQKAPAAVVSQPTIGSAPTMEALLGCSNVGLLSCTGTLIAAAPSGPAAAKAANLYADRDLAQVKEQALDELLKQAGRLSGKQAEEDRIKDEIKKQREIQDRIQKQLAKAVDEFARIQASVGKLAFASASARSKPKAKRPKAVTLGSASFAVAPGTKGALTIPLTAAARKIVKQHGYLVFRQILVTVGPSGKQVIKAKTVVIKRKKAAKPKT